MGIEQNQESKALAKAYQVVVRGVDKEYRTTYEEGRQLMFELRNQKNNNKLFTLKTSEGEDSVRGVDIAALHVVEVPVSKLSGYLQFKYNLRNGFIWLGDN